MRNNKLCVQVLCFIILGMNGNAFPNKLFLWSISGSNEPTDNNIPDTTSPQRNRDVAMPQLK